MSVVTGALGSLAPKLLKLLHDEYKLQKGVKRQVKWLSRELNSIYAFLRKVSDVPWDMLDEQVKVWVREVREASVDMEDVLDTFLVRLEDHEPVDPRRLKSTMKKVCKVFSKAKTRRDIAGAIQDIKSYLDEVDERRQKYKLDEIVSKHAVSTSIIDPRLTAMYKEVTQLIGIDKSRAELISLLSPSHPDNDVLDKKIFKKISIVGVGGLGKTTLARAVYEKISSEYACRAFVSVGRDHDLATVFKDMLFHLDKDKYHNIHTTGRGVYLLIHELREFLKNKRYFIVIDDVWEVRTWEAIEIALVDNYQGSKVITTTRNVDVAKACGAFYRLKPLSYDDSMKLFSTRLSSAERKFLGNQPDHISEKILKKCAGIPLATITMASLLAGKPECEWSMVYNSISFDSRGNREAEDTMTILSFSYYDLPPHLRTCLLYLSKYPEDYEIEKVSLIWMWIAEGFINGDKGTRLFDLGERYFNDLVNRSLIQAVKDEFNGLVSGCRVHDMVLDLVRKISSQENFIAILDGNFEGTPALSNVRRLVNQNRIPNYINSEATVTGLAKVRSYTAFMCFVDSWNLFLRFKLLRVLDIVDCNFKDGCGLEHLGDLLHLRYLGITCQADLELPKQIGNLKLLETLHLYGPLLPPSFVDLTKLVRLYSGNGIPDGIGKLGSLEELVILEGSSDEPERFLKELGSLRELRVLEFYTTEMDESMQRDFVESLSSLQKIQYICLYGSAFAVDIALWEATGFVLPQSLHHLNWFIFQMSKLLSCINPSCLPNLSHLTLRVTTMDEQDLKLLARLPALCSLWLVTESTVTANNINDGNGWFFQKLTHFKTPHSLVHFEQPSDDDASISMHMWNGKDAMPFPSRKNNDYREVISSGVFPNLEVLEFRTPLRALMDNNNDCGNMGLEYLPSLRILRVWNKCSDVRTAAEWDIVFAALKNACNAHPNHPTLYTT